MAKKSSTEKNNRRIRLVKRFAAKRESLKAVANDMALAPEERFAARLKLAELPRNSAPTRIRMRCRAARISPSTRWPSSWRAGAGRGSGR